MKKTRWTAEQIPSQSGRIAVITGANSGIGFESTKQLSRKGAEVIMAVRNTEKGEQARKEITAQDPEAKIRVMRLDLSDLQSVDAFAETFKENYTQLNILLNNAGVMVPPYTKTKDNFELQLGVNHLGHFALTAQLFDVIKKTPAARIVNVSSIAHKRGIINFEDLQSEKSYNKIKAYGQSKLANLLFTYELAGRSEAAGIPVKVLAAHPGVSQTNLMRYIGVFKFLMNLFTQSAAKGALPLLYAAVSPDVENADYIGPHGWHEMKGNPVKVSSNKVSHNPETAHKLWKESEKLTGVTFNVK